MSGWYLNSADPHAMSAMRKFALAKPGEIVELTAAEQQAMERGSLRPAGPEKSAKVGHDSEKTDA